MKITKIILEWFIYPLYWIIPTIALGIVVYFYAIKPFLHNKNTPPTKVYLYEIQDNKPVDQPVILLNNKEDSEEKLFFLALYEKESSCGKLLYGDESYKETSLTTEYKGKYYTSLGPFQIGKLYWQDACEYAGYNYDYHTYVFDYDVCAKIMKAYFERYNANTLEKKARIHNGGPNGFEKSCTEIYWQDVRSIMEKNREKDLY